MKEMNAEAGTKYLDVKEKGKGTLTTSTMQKRNKDHKQQEIVEEAFQRRNMTRYKLNAKASQNSAYWGDCDRINTVCNLIQTTKRTN